MVVCLRALFLVVMRPNKKRVGMRQSNWISISKSIFLKSIKTRIATGSDIEAGVVRTALSVACPILYALLSAGRGRDINLNAAVKVP